MSYAQSQALQAAVYAYLRADAALTDLAGNAIYDALPPGDVPSLYVALGREDVRDASDQTGRGAWHNFRVDVVSDAAGFASAKQAAAAISDALVDAPLLLARGDLIGLRFLKARALRVGTGDSRRIELTFRARVAD